MFEAFVTGFLLVFEWPAFGFLLFGIFLVFRQQDLSILVGYFTERPFTHTPDSPPSVRSSTPGDTPV